jgi:hypothetical protein
VVDLAGSERGSRTKASSLQQKEANNINVSLMQLWRCLQALRAAPHSSANSASEGGQSQGQASQNIPFRESKLTHLLMPVLCKAGTGGVSMIACVNPQGEDYDETLSILNYASLAAKIAYIPAEVIRSNQPSIETTSNMLPLSTAGNIIVPTLGLKTINMEELKEFKDKQNTTSNHLSQGSNAAGIKRRRAEGSTNCVGSIPNINAANKKRSTIKYSVGEMKVKGKDSIAAPILSHRSSSILTETEDSEKLRLEIEELREENNRLLNSQMLREAEIRMEVSQEMAIRSSHLLEQIEELREQLSVFEYPKMGDHNNVRKSAKKARTQQINYAIEEGSCRDLQEAEEELERAKFSFESQISSLHQEKKILEAELFKLKHGRNSDLSTSSRDQTEAFSFSHIGGVASELATRLQRDQRFNIKHNNENENKIKHENIKKSPSRSPLGNVTKALSNSPNLLANDLAGRKVSPMKRVENGLLKPVFQVKKVDFSPQRLRPLMDENASNSGVPYLTRLRSNFMKV